MLLQNTFGGNVAAGITATAGTVITVVAPAHRQGRTRVTKVSYTGTGTAHTLTAMRPLSRTTLSANAAASQAVINLTGDPGTLFSPANVIAANDYLVIRHDDGTFGVYKVSSVSTLQITLTGNLSVACSAGATVWFLGITTDTDPATGLAHPAWTLGTTTNSLTGDGDVLVNSHQEDSPILLYSNNATNAGTFIEVIFRHTKEP
jgi:hypothetical protein